MKRFYAAAAVGSDGAVLLDGRPVRTPARQPLVLPTAALAAAVAAEWNEQGDEIQPRLMPLTGLANAAIDRVAPDPAAFAAPLARYAGFDLLCYRAEAPASLVVAQAAAWDPPLAWAQTRYDVAFTITSGTMPVAQPDATVARLGEALSALDPFRLAGMQPLATIGGSLVVALAVLAGTLEPAAAFLATQVDERWQAERWGEDSLAATAREHRERDFLAAACFLELL